MLFIYVILQSQQGWQHAITKPVLLWDGICNSNVVHYFPLSFITELFILVSKLWVSWYLQVYLQPKVGVISSSFSRQHTLGNSFFCWTMFLTKAIKKKGRIKSQGTRPESHCQYTIYLFTKPRMDRWMSVHARHCGTGKWYQTQILSFIRKSFALPCWAPLFTLHMAG